jgi:(Z)-2-((N-methylformamido)methylene)-5-hydroxybutyrolactone dehydrogenase
VGAVIPWNSPILLETWKLAPALAAGCTFVVKPSEHTSASALELARLIEEAGFPPGVYNVVPGFGVPTGRALVRHPGVDKVAFTGSTETGKQIMKDAADHLAKVSLELGGKSPNIIFDDADLEAALNGVVAGIFAATGQTCMAGSRLFVQRDLEDEVVGLLSERAQAIRLGDPLDPATEMGPVAFKEQLDKVKHYIEVGQQEGAKLVSGGRSPDDEALRHGFFIEPTIFAQASNQMRVAREEIFGPVLVLQPYDTEEEAVRLANDTDYGLAAGVWSADPDRALAVARRIRAGQVEVNGGAFNPVAPFGGYKQSGLGREYGRHGLEEFLEVKAVQR